ncbi:MAG: YtxH domain-containing protein [Flavobacteriales bacterium]
MSDERTSGLVTFLAGLAAGAALGILFAPRSGKETRDAIRNKGRDAKDALDDMLDAGHEKWSAMKGKASDTASMSRDEVNDFVRFMFKEGKDLWERVRTDAEDTAEDVAAKARRAAEDVKRAAHN